LTCVVCGTELREVALQLGERRLLRCERCGARILDPPPSPSELEKEYGASYPPFALAARSPGLIASFRNDWYTARKERWIRGLGFKSVLDVGCGTGEFLVKLRRRGVEVHGLEPSEFAAGYAATHGLHVFQGGVAEYRPGRVFDLITLWNVIEHMPDPAGDLSRLHDLLAPSGTVVILTPDAGSHQANVFGRDWAALEVPRHLQLFNASSLSILAANAGLSLVGVRRSRFDHYYIGVASWVSAIRRRGVLKAARLAPAIATGEDSMLVVWLRRATTTSTSSTLE
jgi:SAM-dependent methyltransferase